MPSFMRVVVASTMVVLASAQGVIISAKGDKGSTPGLQVDPNNSKDANIISQAEITANIVNGCGRTLAGNIDIGEQTETVLAAGNITQVSKGGNVDVTISQRDAQGAGPFNCDIDFTSNASPVLTPLTVTQDKTATAGSGDLTLKVAMPKDLACVGASTGNICTIRCVNAQNFGGCFSVQQSDITPKVNTPENIDTLQQLAPILAQVEQNRKDLVAAVSGLASAPNVDTQNSKVIDAIIAADPEVQSLTATSTAAAAAATSAAAAKKGGKNNGGANNAGAATGAGKKNNNNGNANAATDAATKNSNNNNNNGKRGESSVLRWARRYVVPGVDFSEGDN